MRPSPRWQGALLTFLAIAAVFAPSGSAEIIQDVTSWSQSDQDITFDTVGSPRLRISVLADDLVRVRFSSSGVFTANISRAVAKDDWPVVPFTAVDTGDAVTISTAELNVSVQKSPCVIICRDSLGDLILTDDPTRRIQWGAGYTRVYKTTQPNESYLGLGWRTRGLRRNGTRFVMRNVPTYSDPTVFYGGIPLWHGLRGGKDYAVFFDDTSWGEINVGEQSSEYMFFENLGGQIEYYFFHGPQMSKVLDRYTELTGRPFMPPKWACGYQQSRWSYTPQSEVLSIAGEFRARAIPCDVIYLDIDYMDEGRQLTFDPGTFPDPAGMCAALHAQGFHTVANISPWLLENSTKWNYADYYGYLLKYGSASHRGWHDYVYFVMGAPTGWISWVDFTNTAARNWYESEHASFLSYGIDGIWNDLNEPDEIGGAWPANVKYWFDGGNVDHEKTSTQYSLAQTDFSYDVLRNHCPDKRPFVLSRGAYAGIQRSAAVWSGDNTSSWDHEQINIPMGLSMSISGQPHNGHDIGGFFCDPPGSSNPVSAELYTRWMQWGVFTAFCRQHHDGYGNHASRPYVEPWRFGPTAEDTCRRFIELRYRLMPYLYSLFYQAHTTGAPIHRPTVYDFQGDAITVLRDRDFMFGPFVLVAPVYEPGVSTRSVYLPAGADWIDWWTDATYGGGATVTADAPLDRLPIFVRAGAIIPMGPVVQYADEVATAELTLAVYPASEQTSFTLFEDDGTSWGYQAGACATTVYTASKPAGTLTLDVAARVGSYVPAARSYLMEVRTWTEADPVVAVNGGFLTQFPTKETFDEAPSGYYHDAGGEVVYARFDDAGGDMVVTVSPTTSATSPVGRLVAGWNLVSVPLQPVDADPAVVFQDIAPPNTIVNSLFRYETGSGYVPYPGPAFGDIDCADAYWLYLCGGNDPITVAGIASESGRRVPLGLGWSTIGCPQDAPVLLADCLVSDGEEEKTVEQAAAAGWLQDVIYYYETGSGYRSLRTSGGDDDHLRPWYGYWALTFRPGLELIIPAP